MVRARASYLALEQGNRTTLNGMGSDWAEQCFAFFHG